MNAVETLAITKLVGEKAEDEARKAVAAGSYVTDFWLHISGSIEMGEDYIRKVVQKACPWALLDVALSHLNGTTVESIVREALAADPKLVAEIKARADKAVASIKGTTETLCAGRVKADLAVEVVPSTEMARRAA